MPQFVKFEKADGKPVWINPDHVAFYVESIVEVAGDPELCVTIVGQQFDVVYIRATPESFLEKIAAGRPIDAAMNELVRLRKVGRKVVDARYDTRDDSWNTLKYAICDLEGLVGRS